MFNTAEIAAEIETNIDGVKVNTVGGPYPYVHVALPGSLNAVQIVWDFDVLRGTYDYETPAGNIHKGTIYADNVETLVAKVEELAAETR